MALSRLTIDLPETLPAVSDWEYVLVGGALVGNLEALALHAAGYPYDLPEHEGLVDACAVFFATLDPQAPSTGRRTLRNDALADLGYSQEAWGHWMLACEARFNDWEAQYLPDEAGEGQ